MPRGKGVKKRKYETFLNLTSSSSDEGQSTKAPNPKVCDSTIGMDDMQME